MEKRASTTTMRLEIGMIELDVYRCGADGVMDDWHVSLRVGMRSEESAELPAHLTDDEALLAAKKWAASKIHAMTDVQVEATAEFFAQMAREE